MSRVNNDHMMTFDAGEFYFRQRNAGFADNDGKWIVRLSQELYWTGDGYLRQRRAGKFVGIFATLDEAIDAARNTDRMPIDDRGNLTMGCTYA